MARKTNAELVAIVKKIDKQLDSEEGRLRELLRDRVGTKTPNGIFSINKQIVHVKSVIKELKRDRLGTLNQIT
jgi:hypothetical protein